MVDILEKKAVYIVTQLKPYMAKLSKKKGNKEKKEINSWLRIIFVKPHETPINESLKRGTNKTF